MISTPFVPVPPVKYGGTELIVAGLVEGLLARGHRVTLFTTGDATLPGVERRSLYPQPIWPPEPYAELNHVAAAMRELITRGDIDVIHAHTPAALAFSRMIEPPMLYTIHHARERQLCDLYRANQAPGLTMIAISDRQRELLEDTCDARVVHHGLPTDRYVAGDGRGGYVAFLGRFAREKGPAAAIDAARRAGVPIKLAGRPHLPRDDTYFSAELQPRLAKPGVEWLGEANHDQKLALFGGALASLMPIDWEEPFGLVLIESMLCGTPVLSFRRGSAAEVVDDGITGWLVDDVADMSSKLLALKRGELVIDRARCREHAIRRFHIDRMVDRYEALYLAAAGLTSSSSISSAAV